MAERPITGSLVWTCLVLGTCACSAEAVVSGNPALERNIVATSGWDTLWIAGSKNVNDTLFGYPYEVEVSGDLLVVRDIDRQSVVALDTNGNKLWITGSEGAGPREFGQLADLEFDLDGSLLVFDYGNRRIARIRRDGSFAGLRNLEFFSAPFDMLLPIKDSLVLAAQVAEGGIGVIDRSSWRLGESHDFPWPDRALSNRLRLEGVWVRHPTEPRTRLFAFSYGPGFMIWRDGDVSHHYYVDNIPFALKVSPQIRRAGMDSARYGALAAEAVGDEVYFLFGGRPKRSVHAEEPTRWLDIYGWDGRYRRSYRLPFDTDGMATDGHTIYALVKSPYPQLIALRPEAPR